MAPSGRKVSWGKRPNRKNALNSGHLVLWQCRQASRTNDKTPTQASIQSACYFGIDTNLSMGRRQLLYQDLRNQMTRSFQLLSHPILPPWFSNHAKYARQSPYLFLWAYKSGHYRDLLNTETLGHDLLMYVGRLLLRSFSEMRGW